MQTPVELAQKILSVLDREPPRDAISALKIAMILLPVSPTTEISIPLYEGPKAHEESVLEAQ
jgi:hypothetical protein